jgi:hypothetical protein
MGESLPLAVGDVNAEKEKTTQGVKCTRPKKNGAVP